MPTVTSPIILDSTGQQIVQTLGRLAPKVYGVSGINSGTSLTRTDDAVGKTVTLGTSEITSDFDSLFPWCAMRRIKDSDGNVFVSIPKFYSKKTPTTWQISNVPLEGFTTLFVDGNGLEIPYVLVGAYKGSVSDSKLKSVTGVSPAVSQTMATFRTYAQANGTGYQLTDYLIRSIIELLFVIEFATTDSQSIMRGLCDVSASHVTGGTDGVATVTGQPTDRTNGGYQCKYRGIEDLWGNVWESCDGLSFSGASVYLSIDPSDYTSGKTTGTYELVGTRAAASGNPQTITHFSKYPSMGYVTAVGTSNFGDYSWYDAGGQILLVGGAWNGGSGDGLFDLLGYGGASFSSSSIGCRLCYKPF